MKSAILEQKKNSREKYFELKFTGELLLVIVSLWRAEFVFFFSLHWDGRGPAVDVDTNKKRMKPSRLHGPILRLYIYRGPRKEKYNGHRNPLYPLTELYILGLGWGKKFFPELE